MKARLLALAADCAREPGAPLGERVNAMMCLATFLSYIAFDGAAGMALHFCCQRHTVAQARISCLTCGCNAVHVPTSRDCSGTFALTQQVSISVLVRQLLILL